MGQYLRPDVVKKMAATSSTLLTLPSGSNLTIGGQQYAISSPLTLTLSGLSAVTLYMVYLVISGGVPTLVYSTNVNSVGPAGYTGWKLISAFYSDTTPAFGSFVNIEGVPVCSEITYTPTFSNLSGFAVMQGKFYRSGRRAYIEISSLKDSNAGTGAQVTATTPPNVLIDFSMLPNNATDVAQSYGVGRYGAGGARATASVLNSTSPYGNNVVFLSTDGATVTGASITASGVWQISIPIPVVGWSETPLKDL